MSNPPPSAEKYGAKTIMKAVGECKNEQSAAIRCHPLSNTTCHPS